MADMIFGFVPSTMDGTEHKFDEIKNLPLPKSYSYVPYLSPIQNQGRSNTCVPTSISAHLNWNKNVDNKNDNNRDNNIDIQQIYGIRTVPGDNGMSFKEALHFLRNSGVNTDLGNTKILEYALVKSELALKQALVLNGPCVCGMMVYNMGPQFWDKNQYENNYGGHATAIVGYNEKGFIIRNSWGSQWANRGYSVLSYADFNKYMIECWTIID